MEYLLKASAIIVIFYACYKICLQRDTFFEQNRLFLLTGLITAVFIPLIVIPIYVEQPAINLENLVFVEDDTAVKPTGNPLDVLFLLNTMYLLGIVVFSLRFILQITSLLPLIVNSKKQKVEHYNFIKTNKAVLPFSFFNYIVYNPKQFSDSELEQIITHEKVHASQYHTFDILLAQLACIVFWFNPFIWFYNKALKQNLEFIADKTAINFSNCKKSYQYTLLKTSMPTHQLALTNNFYNSLIKKRIVMLHKSKSKKINLLKFALIIPVLVLFLMSFNTKEVIIEKKLAPTNSNSPEELPVFNELLNILKPETVSNPIVKPLLNNLISKKPELTFSSLEVIITKDYSDSDFEKLKTKFKNEGVILKIKDVKRNKQGEITAIKIEVNSKSSNANYSTNTDEAISPIKISVDEDGKNISIGNGHLKKEHQMVFISKDGKKHEINNSDSDNNVFVISSDDDDSDDIEIKTFVLKDGDTSKILKKHKVKMIHFNSDEDSTLVRKKGGKKLYKVTVKTDGDNNDMTWTTEDTDDKKVMIKNAGHETVKIVSTDGKEPLFLVDGKEISQEEMSNIEPDTIESVSVLKGDGATKKYGDKGKDGVVEITLKK
ncbi:M56 family metallopeptidase [Gaetbulibacter sp. M235]|uniref:M56 family metallopeptidase n=1 Tax=Gaetbulibacter sp. M235 TaxID=3126510 RepID=UPI00374E7DB4